MPLPKAAWYFFGSLRLSRNMFNVPFSLEDDLAIAVFKKCFLNRQATFFEKSTPPTNHFLQVKVALRHDKYFRGVTEAYIDLAV